MAETKAEIILRQKDKIPKGTTYQKPAKKAMQNVLQMTADELQQLAYSPDATMAERLAVAHVLSECNNPTATGLQAITKLTGDMAETKENNFNLFSEMVKKVTCDDEW